MDLFLAKIMRELPKSADGWPQANPAGLQAQQSTSSPHSRDSRGRTRVPPPPGLDGYADAPLFEQEKRATEVLPVMVFLLLLKNHRNN